MAAPDLHRRLRLLFLPWTWLVFVPFLAVSTTFWAIIAGVLSLVNPLWAFHCGTAWAYCLCWVGLFRVRVRGKHHVAAGQSYIIMANHQSLFDTLVVYGHWRQPFRWVMKYELRKAPFLGWACARIGHIFIDRTNHTAALRSLREAGATLTPGTSIFFFPEGRRSRTGHMLPFKKGGFQLALSLGLPILPVTIRGTRRVLPDHALLLRPGRVDVLIHPPIDTRCIGPNGYAALMQQVVDTIAAPLPPEEKPLPRRRNADGDEPPPRDLASIGEHDVTHGATPPGGSAESALPVHDS